MTQGIPLSGRQTTIAHGPYTADIASIGASLRTLRHDGRDLVLPYDVDEVRPRFRGAILAPWPNRVVGGRYAFEGISHELALTEPSRGHALHGLVAWQDWATVEEAPDATTLATTVTAQTGYPFRLGLEVSYRLDDTGLHTTVTALNTGPRSAPYGTAPHPYLVAGPGGVDAWTLELPADTVQLVSDDLLVPTGLAPVSSDERFDFRAPRPIGSTELDHAFTDLRRTGPDRTTTVRLTTRAGTGAAMTWGEDCPWVQIHTADLPDPAETRLGLAVEPMTCPPGAFNSGTDVTVLRPGRSHEAHWSISTIAATERP